MTEILDKKNIGNVFGTFGVYRYILSSMVVLTHTGPSQWIFAGFYAVSTFFILSGYVVSYILHNTYLPQSRGVWKYAANRMLRIYPLYWLVFIGSVALIVFYPKESLDLYPGMSMPDNIGMWIVNIIAFPIMHPVTGIVISSVVVPVGWTIGIELFYWALMPKMMQSNKARRNLVIFAVLYTALVIVVCIPYGGRDSLLLRYYNLPSASLAFSVGCLLFVRKLHGKYILSKRAGWAAIAAFVGWTAIATMLPDPFFVGFYVAFVINAVVIAYLTQIDKASLPRGFQVFDRVCGDMTYPLYLVHLPVAILVHAYLPALATGNYPFFAFVLVASSVLAFVLHQLVETQINRVKKRIKSGVRNQDSTVSAHS